MYKHQGKNRTLKHNLQIATILSLVAGIVNVTGFLSIKLLTTHVTGHFSLIINNLANFKFSQGLIYFVYIFSFLLGSFLSSLLIEIFKKHNKLNVYIIPTLIECLILISIAIFSIVYGLDDVNIIACLLLFVMGWQNSFVTKISNAVVRTTHLTGLITDLGIDISHLFFPKIDSERKELKANIKLRVFIITSFFIGGLIGSYLYITVDLKLNTLIFAAIILFTSLFYDNYRYGFIKINRRFLKK